MPQFTLKCLFPDFRIFFPRRDTNVAIHPKLALPKTPLHGLFARLLKNLKKCDYDPRNNGEEAQESQQRKNIQNCRVQRNRQFFFGKSAPSPVSSWAEHSGDSARGTMCLAAARLAAKRPCCVRRVRS